MTITQSEINSLLSMITVKLGDTNFIKWSYQFQSVLEVNDLFSYFDGSYPCPPRFVVSEEGSMTREISEAYKEWKMVDKALIGLLMATLDDDVMDIIVGSRSSREAWLALQERFSSVSRASIMQLKIDLQTIKKGADSIEKYLLRIKHAKDQLSSVGVTMVDEDIIVVTLNGLPEEYSMIMTVIRARDDSISFKDLRAQLLAAERDIEAQFSLSGSMTARGSSNFKGSSSNGANNFSGGKRKRVWNDSNQKSNWSGTRQFSQGQSSNSFFGGGAKCQICDKKGHTADNCYRDSICEFCGRQGHIARICFNNPASPNYRPGNGDYRSNSGASPECQLCNKRRHTAINCPSRNEFSSVLVCQICGLKGHTALDCPHRSNYTFQGSNPPATITAMYAHTHGASSSGVSPNEVWIGDTGATHHMTSDLRNLVIAHPYDSTNSITIGNGEGQNVKGNPSSRKEHSLGVVSVYYSSNKAFSYCFHWTNLSMVTPAEIEGR